jgi:hypothetical protein
MISTSLAASERASSASQLATRIRYASRKATATDHADRPPLVVVASWVTTKRLVTGVTRFSATTGR